MLLSKKNNSGGQGVNPKTTGVGGSFCPTLQKNVFFNVNFHNFSKRNFKNWLNQQKAMDISFHFLNSVRLYVPYQLNCDQFSEGSEKRLKYVCTERVNTGLGSKKNSF